MFLEVYYVKGLLHPKMKILSVMTHPHVILQKTCIVKAAK